jgi:hypothetical protein
MKIENLFRNLRVLWRADAIIAQMRLQHMLAGLGLKALAALIAAFGLLMLELAAYFALVVTWSAVASALLLGGVNFIIALTIVLIAARRTPGRDLELALDLHKSSVEALQSDAVAIQSDFASLRTALSHPLDTSLTTLVVPAAGLLIKALKKYREPTAAA